MPDRLTDITAARTALREAEFETRRIDAELTREEARIDDLRRRGETAELETTLDRVDALREERTTVANRLADVRDRLGGLREDVLDPSEADLLADLDTDLPIALFPIRLETRFVGDGDDAELLVRVYPDAIHSDSHEPELTEIEVTWGEHFWRQTWRAGRRDAIRAARDAASGEERDARERDLDAHEERVRAAWRQLTDGYGVERAAYVAHALEPTNPEARPALPIDPDAPLPVDPAFPSPPVDTEAWTRAPRTDLLPDRWIAVGFRDDERAFEHRGPSIPDRLSTGPGPDPTVSTEDPDPDDGLPPIDPGMRWLVNFDAAVDVGMGLRIPVSPAVADSGLDRLLVYGVKTTMTGEEGAERLTELLDAHRYTDGLSFVPPGTPTNDVSDVVPDADEAESSYEVALGDPLVTEGVTTNGTRAARALGIDPSTFAHVEHADGIDDHDARHMNTALWSASWGYYLQQMFGGRLPRARIKDARRHFIDYVRARGPLPTLRVGQQPYGLLPVTSTRQWSGADPEIVRFLTLLRERFLREGVPRVPRVTEESGSVRDFLRLLSMHSASTAVVARYLAGKQLLTAGEKLAEISEADSDAWWAVHERLARRPIDELDADWNGSLPNLFRLQDEYVPLLLAAFVDTATLLDGPMVQGETGGVGYIRWLLDASPARIRNETFSPPFSRPPDSLLYLLLRHATLHEYATATFDLLTDLGRLDGTRLVEPQLVDVFPDRPTVTVWDMLNQPIGELLDDPIEDLSPDTRIADALGTVTSGLSAHLTEVANLPPGTTARPITTATRPALGTATLAPGTRFVPPATTARPAFGPVREPGVAATFERDPSTALLATTDVELRRPFRIDFSAITDVADSVRPSVPRTPQFNEFAGSLAYLSTRPPEVLELLQSETLDLASYRLDAWLTSYATRRLDDVRDSQPTGVYVGGYGTVEDLRPTSEEESDGYLHAPSLPHAATGAILRSGYRSHADTPLGELLGMDLSSERIRLAKSMLDGVRQGQPLGALLGYRFERALHEEYGGELDQYLPVLRELAPLTGEHVDDERVPTESDPPSNVVDGLKLHERGADVFVDERLPGAGAERTAIQREIDALGEAIDAVRDAVTAESVYQTVLGNPDRAGATMEAVATGEVPPPELSFVETQRNGVAHTHRLFVLFDESTAGAPAWPTNDDQVRAPAEPTLNAWVGSVLGDPADVRCRATYLDPETDEPLSPPGTVTLSLDELALSPLDAVALADIEGAPDRSELEERLAYHLLSTRADDVPEEAGVRLVFERDPAWGSDVVSVAEFLELASTLRRVITNGRAADAADLSVPEAVEEGTPVVGPLAARADAASDALDSAHAVLSSVVATVETATDAEETWKPLLDPLRDALLQASYVGLPSAVPASPAGRTQGDCETLLGQGLSVRDELERRQAALADLDVPDDPTADTAAARDYQVERLQTILGDDFRVLPRFAPPNAAELGETFAASEALQGGDVDAAETWLGRWAHVRDNVRPVRDLFTYERAMDRDNPSLTVGQLPHEADDRWVALPAEAEDAGEDGDDGEEAQASKLSLVAHVPGAADGAALDTSTVAGLFVDEWVETVPSESATTGVTFHYDDPEARPPQAVLLAVRPDERDEWDLDTLESTVLDGFELAKLRMVDTDSLPGLGQFLPALYFANNVEGDTIATDFTRLVREEE